MKEIPPDVYSFLIILLLLGLLLLGVGGNASYEDELREQEFYNEMVCFGAWPDYKELGVECEDSERRPAGSQDPLR
jgi:hypothetical protein